MEKKLILTNNGTYDYADYLEYCEMNEIEPSPEGSSKFYEWCGEMDAENVECDLCNLKYVKASKENYKFFITGSLGLWNGRKNIHSVKMFSLVDAIMSAINAMDCQCYYDVHLEEDGTIGVSVSHHDGTNYFSIRRLNAKGIKAVDKLIEYGTIRNNDVEIKEEWFRKIKPEDIFW